MFSVERSTKVAWGWKNDWSRFGSLMKKQLESRKIIDHSSRVLGSDLWDERTIRALEVSEWALEVRKGEERFWLENLNIDIAIDLRNQFCNFSLSQAKAEEIDVHFNELFDNFGLFCGNNQSFDWN